MDSLWLGLVVMVGFSMGLIALLAVQAAQRNEEWVGHYRGHELKLVRQRRRQRLYVDNELVDERHEWTFQKVALSATVPLGTRRTVRVTGYLQIEGRRSSGTLLVDGRWVGGDPPPQSLERVTAADSASLPSDAEEVVKPRDHRWPSAAKLLRGIQTTIDDEDVLSVVERLDLSIRHVLHTLDNLAEAQEAHQIIGGDMTPDSRLPSLRDANERRVREMFQALQDLHLAAASLDAVQIDRSLEHVEDVLDRMDEETDVNGMGAFYP